MNKDWQQQAVQLSRVDGFSWRKIAKILEVPKSSVSDLLREYYKFVEVSKSEVIEGNTHLVIPDSQVKPNVSLDYLHWIGSYIARKQPQTIIHLGDFCDFSSLGTYDKGKRSAEGRRVQEDIEASIKGMETLLAPVKALQQRQKKSGEAVYSPRMVLTLGNHCDRLTRHVESNPELHGFLSMDALKFKEFGWEVIPFLTPVNVDGVNYCHYYPNVMTGKPLSGTALNMLKVIGESFIMGHRQILDVSTRFLPTSGKQQWGIVAGACYTHEESYKGKQGNHHWRGIITLHNVKDGSFDPLFVSLDWLERQYGKR